MSVWGQGEENRERDEMLGEGCSDGVVVAIAMVTITYYACIL